MRQVLLLRGVNVGGKRLTMEDFRQGLAGAGASAIRTYVQSGNAVFDGPLDSAALQLALRERAGFAPEQFLYEAAEFAALAKASPYDLAQGRSLHLFFLARPPAAPDLEALHHLARADEVFTLTPRVLYLATPAGIGRSALVERLPRLLGVPMTARNGNTVAALVAMAMGQG